MGVVLSRQVFIYLSLGLPGAAELEVVLQPRGSHTGVTPGLPTHKHTIP